MVIIKDEIHRNIELNEFEKKIMDSKEFQRLRKIKQLAMTYLVYPSATHTRFEHALGTTHLSSLICEKLGLDKEITQKIRLYSLLHDIGHTAFSHESEKILESLLGDHEKIGKEKILKGEIADILNTQFNPKEITELSKTFYGQIISSSIGSDRMDYLLRDSHNTGVAYGVIDSDRIIHTMFLDEKDKVLGISLRGLEAAESLLVGRFMMFSTVYLHHTVRIASAMLRRSISLSIESYSLSPEDFLLASDEEILLKLLNSKNENSKDLAKNLMNRKLYKVAHQCDYSQEIEKNAHTIRNKIKENFKGDFIIDFPVTFSSPPNIPVKVDNELHSLESLSALVNSLKNAEEKRKKILFLCEEKHREKLGEISKKVLSS